MRKLRAFTLSALILLLTTPGARADEAFRAEYWAKGIHLLGGIGLSSSVYNNDSSRRHFGAGSYLKTDLGYFLNDSWSLEWSSGVKFNQVDEFLVWDTMFTVGVRYRIPYVPIINSRSTFIRAFIGSSPTVVFLNDAAPEEYKDLGVERVHFDGRVYGAAIGEFHNSRSGRVWFYEASISTQELLQQDGIRMEGEVPISILKSATNDQSRIFSVYVAAGALFF